ncbi:MAG: hypothetical protein LBH98_04875 [Chitinispirillales bacterium]|jgi:hypothetical protein|nr:hypothetical protein [Chitinispirillales bacterium]
MVLTKLLSNENGIIRYLYQPEKDGEPGILLYNKKDDMPEIEKLAENDIKSTFYRNHVFTMIRKNINNLPDEMLLSWY